MTKYIKLLFLLLSICVFIGCEEKPRANITVGKDLMLPITCMKLNTIGTESKFIEVVKSLYAFDEKCDLIFSMSYKKDIVCNSPYNAVTRSTTRFPKSFLKIELRKGLNLQYTYYIDLYDNVVSDDVKEGFIKVLETLKVDK